LQLIWFVLFAMYLIMGIVLFGPWHSDMSNLEDAYTFMSIVVLGPDIGDLYSEYIFTNVIQAPGYGVLVRFYFQLAPFLFWVIVTNLALGIICDGYDMARNKAKESGAKSLAEDVFDLSLLEFCNRLGIWPKHQVLRRALKPYVKGDTKPRQEEKTQQDKDLELLLEPFLRAMNLDALPGNTAKALESSETASVLTTTESPSKPESKDASKSERTKSKLGKLLTRKKGSGSATSGAGVEEDASSVADTQSDTGTSHSKGSKSSKSVAVKEGMKNLVGGAGNMLGATGLFSMDALDGSSEAAVELPLTLTFGNKQLDEEGLLEVLLSYRKKMEMHEELRLENLASTDFNFGLSGVTGKQGNKCEQCGSSTDCTRHGAATAEAACSRCRTKGLGLSELFGVRTAAANIPKPKRPSQKQAQDVFRHRDAATVVTTAGVAGRIIQTFQFQEEALQKTQMWDAHRSRNKQHKFSPEALVEVRAQLDRLVNDQQDMKHRLLKTAGMLVQAQAYGRLPSHLHPDAFLASFMSTHPATELSARTQGLQQQVSVMDSNPLFAL